MYGMNNGNHNDRLVHQLRYDYQLHKWNSIHLKIAMSTTNTDRHRDEFDNIDV